MRHARSTGFVVMLLLLLSACTDKSLQILSKALDDTAHGVAVLQTVVIEANAQNLLSDDSARSLMEFSIKVNMAGQDAVAIARNIDSLDPASRQKLTLILTPIAETLKIGQTLGNSIMDVNVRQRVTAAIALIQVAVNSAQLALATN